MPRKIRGKRREEVTETIEAYRLTESEEIEKEIPSEKNKSMDEAQVETEKDAFTDELLRLRLHAYNAATEPSATAQRDGQPGS
ncbi:hypothetical protein NDU88_001252 [Pleurodeles waltl]|uniref:Uncharacterized protein n=1 Tax=Pleurodeles waltl TaxID=8319 RepID=A0AAV7R6I0_PLEWA|nr:hypothetical protein NDU88_001252 [Pleurodeles waltl]